MEIGKRGTRLRSGVWGTPPNRLSRDASPESVAWMAYSETPWAIEKAFSCCAGFWGADETGTRQIPSSGCGGQGSALAIHQHILAAIPRKGIGIHW